MRSISSSPWSLSARILYFFEWTVELFESHITISIILQDKYRLDLSNQLFNKDRIVGRTRFSDRFAKYVIIYTSYPMCYYEYLGKGPAVLHFDVRKCTNVDSMLHPSLFAYKGLLHINLLLLTFLTKIFFCLGWGQCRSFTVDILQVLFGSIALSTMKRGMTVWSTWVGRFDNETRDRNNTI